MRRLAAVPHLDAVGLSPDEVDLTKPAGPELLKHLEPETAIVMCSAIKRQAGDTLENYQANVAMTVTLAAALRERPAGRVVFFSSAAVYGEDVENAAISERTPVEPVSYYGMAKYAGERLLLKAVEARKPSPLVILRPPTIYGPGEPGLPYGPTGFLRAALAKETVTLWGDGSEKREFVFVEDACSVALTLLDHPFSGVLNLASGRTNSFLDVLAAASRLAGAPKTESRPRSKRQVDQGFDNELLRELLPGFSFTSLDAGLKAIHDAELSVARR